MVRWGLIIAFLFGLFACLRASEAWTLVAHQAAASPNSSSACGPTAGVNTTGADLIVVGATGATGGGTGVLSDSNSNTWQSVASIANGTGGQTTFLYYVRAPIVGAGHTFTYNGTACALNVAAFSGSAVSPLDQSATNQSDGGAPPLTFQIGSVTPTRNNQLIISAEGNGGGGTFSSIDQSFTALDVHDQQAGVNYGNGIAYLIQNAASAVNPTWTLNTTGGNWSGINATFKSPACIGSLALMGVGC